MPFDFDYSEETLKIDNHVFVLQEYSNGAYEKLQSDFFGDVRLSTKKEHLEQQMNQKRVNFTEFAQYQVLLGVKSWTYKGREVPINIENWRGAPKRVTDAAEKVIERLNPKDSDEFQNGHGDGSES